MVVFEIFADLIVEVENIGFEMVILRLDLVILYFFVVLVFFGMFINQNGIMGANIKSCPSPFMVNFIVDFSFYILGYRAIAINTLFLGEHLCIQLINHS